MLQTVQYVSKAAIGRMYLLKNWIDAFHKDLEPIR